MEALLQQIIALGANRIEAVFHRYGEMGAAQGQMPGREEGRRKSEDEQEQDKASQLALSASSVCNEGDYVRKAYRMRSAFRKKPLFLCDNQCSERTLSFWQFASEVIKEGEKSYATNLCQKCYNESLTARGDKPLTKWRWYQFVVKKAHHGRLWTMTGKEQCKREMWEYFCQERLRVIMFREEAEKERRAGYRASVSRNRQPESAWSK